MSATVSDDDVKDVLRLVASKTPNADAQLTILAIALITGARSCGVSRDRMLELLSLNFDCPLQQHAPLLPLMADLP